MRTHIHKINMHTKNDTNIYTHTHTIYIHTHKQLNTHPHTNEYILTYQNIYIDPHTHNI